MQCLQKVRHDISHKWPNFLFTPAKGFMCISKKPSDRGHIYGIYCTIKKHWIKSITDLSYLTAHEDINMQTISYYPCPQLSNVG